MSAIDPAQLPQHLRADGYDGYLYVIAMSSGIVKVGRTCNPRGRIASHINTAARFGVTLTNLWLSPRHQGYIRNETRLINNLGVSEYGNEYFRVPFARAVQLAESLEYEPLSDADRATREAAADARAEAFAKSLFGTQRMVCVPDDAQLVFVPSNVSAWALQQIFSTELPQGLQDSDDAEAIPPLVERIAAVTDIAAEEIWDWSYIDVVRHMAKTVIDTECSHLEVRAIEAGRFDLVDPAFLPDLASAPPYLKGGAS